MTRRAANALITHRGHCRQCLNALMDRKPDQMCEQGAALLAKARAAAQGDRGAQPPGQRTGCCMCGCHQKDIQPDPCVQAGRCICLAAAPSLNG